MSRAATAAALALVALLLAACGGGGGDKKAATSTLVQGIDVGTTSIIDLHKIDPAYAISLPMPTATTVEKSKNDLVLHVNSRYDVTVTRIANKGPKAVLTDAKNLVLNSGFFADAKVLSESGDNFVYQWRPPAAKKVLVSFYRAVAAKDGATYRFEDGPSVEALKSGDLGGYYTKDLAVAFNTLTRQVGVE